MIPSTEQEVCRELCRKLRVCFEHEQKSDPSLIVLDHPPHLFALARRGHLLTVSEATEADRDSRIIAYGQMEWKPGSEDDEPFLFRITRSPFYASKLRLNDGPDLDIEGIAEDVVTTFLKHAD